MKRDKAGCLRSGRRLNRSRFIFYAAMLLLTGCKSVPFGFSPGKHQSLLENTQGAAETLTVLSAIGGLCLIAGMVLLVVSRGARGWYACVGGVILIILNYMVAEYADYLFPVILTFTGTVSAAWTYKTVKQILLEKKDK